MTSNLTAARRVEGKFPGRRRIETLWLRRPAIAVMAAGAFAAVSGCATLPRSIGPDANARLAAAEHRSTDSSRAVALALSVAEEARAGLAGDAADPDDRAYNRAMAVVASRVLDGSAPAEWRREFKVETPMMENRKAGTGSESRQFVVRWAPSGDGTSSCENLTDVELPERLTRRGYRELKTRPGIGAPIVLATTADSAFAPAKGWASAATLVADFKGRGGRAREVVLTLVDPKISPTVSVGGRTFPLAGNFTAPLMYITPNRSEFWTGLRGLLRPDSLMKGSRLHMLEKYRPDRTPIVLVHGLMSTPLMWRDVVNEIEGDPELCGRYQFWVFYYPTANPVLYSADLLRKQLDEALKRYNVNGDLILVGHSMGGVLSRLQVTDSGDDFWNSAFGGRAEAMKKKPKVWAELKDWFYFKPNPRVSRVVFICTPHRGSSLTEGWFARLGLRLVRAPSRIVRLVTTVISAHDLGSTGLFKGHLPSSITGLTPRNPTLITLDSKPIHATYHSIIGDGGKGDSPLSSDGIVEYRSSHLEGAASELIVPHDHGAYDDVECVSELKRILKLHALEKKSGRGRNRPDH